MMQPTDHLTAFTEDTARRVAKARRQGDEHRAHFLYQHWLRCLPPYRTQERRDQETLYAEVYRKASR